MAIRIAGFSRVLSGTVIFILISAASSFLLFCFFEIFPDISKYFFSDECPYYAIKRQYVPDPDMIFKRRPNLFFDVIFKGDVYRECYGVKHEGMRYEVRFNENGYLNQGKSEQPEIVVAGDSYMEFGLNYSDLFTERLQKHIQKKVSNYGTGWHGPFQYLETIKKYGLRQKPQKILFCFFEGNDLNDIREFMRWRRTGKYYQFNFGGNIFERYQIALKDVYSYLKSKLKSKMIILNPEIMQPCTDHLADLKLSGGQLSKAVFTYPVDMRSPEEIESSAEMAALEKILSEYREVAIQNKVKPVFLFIPTAAHIYAEYSTDQSGKSWLEIRERQIMSKSNLESVVKSLTERIGIPYLSLTPLFEEEAKKGSFLYYPFDTHWNSQGREIAASWVAREMDSL